jgi:hypothetical protein
MYRLASILVVGLAVGPGWAAPKLKPKQPEAPSLVGTTWVGVTSDSGGPLVLEFRADGELAVTYNGRPTPDCGWRQDGDKVYYHMNKQYLEFNGKVIGDKLEGTSHNRAGKVWETALTRDRGK